jgi:thiamine biosynthesis lipoprotein
MEQQIQHSTHFPVRPVFPVVPFFFSYLLQFFSWFPILLFPLLLVGCGNKEDVFRQESFVFGTRVEISIHGAETARAETAAKAVLQRFDELHRKLHAWQPSQLEQLNAAFAAGTRTAVDPELAAILQDAREYALQIGELFNPAIGNLIRLWGFHADLPQSAVPGDEAIAREVQAAPSMRDVHVENGQAWSDNPAVRIDLGGYAKGYALDEAAKILKRQGVRNALVNIGGNVLALGAHGERPWKVGVQHPRKSGIIATLELHDGESIGTSGDYQRYFEAGGRRYCHLIDPRSGKPASGMQSVTILVSGEHAGTRSDVLSKPLFIAGPDRLAATATAAKLAGVLAVSADGSVLVSPELQQRLQWREPGQAFRLLR